MDKTKNHKLEQWFIDHPSVSKAILFKLYVIPGLFIMTYSITGKLYESLMLLIIAIIGGFFFFMYFEWIYDFCKNKAPDIIGKCKLKKRIIYGITYTMFFTGVVIVCILEKKQKKKERINEREKKESSEEIKN